MIKIKYSIILFTIFVVIAGIYVCYLYMFVRVYSISYNNEKIQFRGSGHTRYDAKYYEMKIYDYQNSNISITLNDIQFNISDIDGKQLMLMSKANPILKYTNEYDNEELFINTREPDNPVAADFELKLCSNRDRGEGVFIQFRKSELKNTIIINGVCISMPIKHQELIRCLGKPESENVTLSFP